jgi:hypothetical protein
MADVDDDAEVPREAVEGTRSDSLDGAVAPPLPTIGRAGQTAIASIVAWLVTDAATAFARGVGVAAKISAALALIALIAAAALHGLKPPRDRLAPHIGITLFVALSVATWLLGAPAIHPSRLDPVRGAIGALAWGVFALSWSDRTTKPALDPHDPSAPLLQARSALPPFAVPLGAVGALTTLALLTLAWRVHEVERALVAQALAVGLSVWIVGAAATVAIARGRRRSGVGRRVSSHAIRRLLVLGLIAIGGAIVIALR